MKRLMGVMVLCAGCAFIAVPGCGGGHKATNVGENADAKAMADYEAAIKADAEAMKKNAPAGN